MSEPLVLPRPSTVPSQRTQLLPPYHVILLNDEDHSFEFVVDVLRKVFGLTLEKAYQLTLIAHEQGRAILWTGPKEVAELKAEQIGTFHEIRTRDQKKLGPVDCTIEPAA